MRQSSKKIAQRRAMRKKLVNVAVATDINLARQYKKILLKYGIHSIVSTKQNGPSEFNFELLVRQSNFDSAYNIIKATNAGDDYFSTFFQIDQSRPKAV